MWKIDFGTSSIKPDIYIDLENPDDYQKLQRPTAFLEKNQTKLICLDEIQRYPHFFEILRSHVDKQNRPRQFLILGSASRDLIQQSSESLAGRLRSFHNTIKYIMA